MQTIAVQQVLPDERWAVRVVFAVMPDGEPWPVDVRVQLLPEHVTPRALQENQHVIKDREVVDPWSAVLDGAVPAGGLSQRALCQVKLASIAQRIDLGARTVLALPLDDETRQVMERLVRSSVRRPGRPPARPLADTLALLHKVADRLANGQTLTDIARSLNMSRGSLRDLLSWARNDAEPRLFTNPGRGRRGGTLTPAARAMLDDLEKRNRGKRRQKS